MLILPPSVSRRALADKRPVEVRFRILDDGASGVEWMLRTKVRFTWVALLALLGSVVVVKVVEAATIRLGSLREAEHEVRIRAFRAAGAVVPSCSTFANVGWDAFVLQGVFDHIVRANACSIEFAVVNARSARSTVAALLLSARILLADILLLHEARSTDALPDEFVHRFAHLIFALARFASADVDVFASLSRVRISSMEVLADALVASRRIRAVRSWSTCFWRSAFVDVLAGFLADIRLARLLPSLAAVAHI